MNYKLLAKWLCVIVPVAKTEINQIVDSIEKSAVHTLAANMGVLERHFTSLNREERVGCVNGLLVGITLVLASQEDPKIIEQSMQKAVDTAAKIRGENVFDFTGVKKGPRKYDPTKH